jgi:uncharacterized metal-binding protein
MKVVVRSLGVVYPCRGCTAHGDGARQVALLLERRGLAEAATDVAKARVRYPVIAIDGCADECVRRWLGDNGIVAQRHYVLAGADAHRSCEAIAADLQ